MLVAGDIQPERSEILGGKLIEEEEKEFGSRRLSSDSRRVLGGGKKS